MLHHVDLVSDLIDSLVDTSVVKPGAPTPYGSNYHIPATEHNARMSGQVNPHTVRFILSKYVSDSKTFCTNLYKWGGAIVGSLALQILIGEVYYNSDMDVYVPGVYVEELVRWLLQEGYVEIHINKSERDYYPKMPLVCKLENSITGAKIDVLTGCKGCKSDTVNHVVLGFDLTCCMVFFNGKDVFSYYYHLTVNRISVYVKNISNGVNTYNRDVRVSKYRNRGFTILDYAEDIPENIISYYYYYSYKGPEFTFIQEKTFWRYIESPYNNVRIAVNAMQIRRELELMETRYDSRHKYRPRSVYPQITMASRNPYTVNKNKDVYEIMFGLKVRASISVAEANKVSNMAPFEGARKYHQMYISIIEELGLPAKPVTPSHNLYCVVLSCDINRGILKQDLIASSAIPAGVYPDIPLYANGGYSYRELVSSRQPSNH